MGRRNKPAVIKRADGLVQQGIHHQYNGLLDEPLSPPHALFTDSDWKQFSKTIAKKLFLLLVDCGVDLADPAAYQKALLELAKRHVPGFQVPRSGPGRPQEQDDIELLMRFELLISGYGYSVRQASVIVAAQKCILGQNGMPQKAETLRTRYRTARKQIPLFRNIFKRLGKERATRLFQETVDDMPARRERKSDSI
jgi:hypothetical protein